MSDYRKGTRKPKNIVGLREVSIGGYRIPPALAVAVLLAAMYATFLLGSRLEKGTDALMLSVLSVLSFAVFAYLTGRGSLPGLKPFVQLIDAFLALSALTLAWGLATFLNIAGSGGITGPLAMSIACAAFTILLIGLVLHHEKDKLGNIHVKAGSVVNMAAGAAGLVVCILLGAGATYFVLGGASMSTGRIVDLLGIVLVFSVLSAACEELWFRGLLLSRLVPLIGNKGAVILQAVVSGTFEAVMLYAIAPRPPYLPVAFIVGSVLGYYWGRMTLKDDSIVGAALFHAGFYALIGLPMFAGML